jgi:aldehyde:ferredoxin oxidoreductase
MNKDGQEIVSPLEYETIGLLGTNCGLRDPDEVALLNEIANDLGVDTIELGGMIGVLMEAGKAAFGDVDFMVEVLKDLRAGNPAGRFYASGTAAVGEALKVARVPVIKRQAISAYDPRIIEVTAISMMVTAQGADHTAGNAPSFVSHDKSVREVAEESYRMQVNSALADSFGLCVFGRTVTDPNRKLVADAINDAFDAGIDPKWLIDIARETLRLEARFNTAAGFTEAADELPAFFADEPLPPTNRKARLVAAEVNGYLREFSDDPNYVIT